MDIVELTQTYEGFNVPRFDLAVDTQVVSESDGVVSDLTVETTLNGADRVSVVLAYSFDHEQHEFTELDWELFSPGTRVEVAMGYGDTREPLFVGKLTTVRPMFSADVPPAVEVSGYGLLHDMMRETHSRSWDEATDSDVVRDLAFGYEFGTVTVEDTELIHRKIVQERQNDYHFLTERAERNGFEFFARRDTLFFRAPAYGNDPVATLRLGDQIQSFSPELNAAEQVGTVEVRHWDPVEKAEIVGVAEGDDGGDGRTVIQLPVRSTAEAEALAAVALDRIEAGLVQGHGETIGIPAIQAGETIRLLDFGERFSGDYYVEEATHRIGESGYTTSFEVTERPV